MIRLLIVTFIFLSIYAKSQREDHTWYFSNTNKGLFFDYNTNNVSITSTHAPMNEAGAFFVAASNTTGDVMFYTDGTKIWDKTNQIMPNANGLLNGPHTLQTGLCCIKPNSQNQYYLFNSTGEVPNSGNVYYSIINMSLAGNGDISNPLGDIETGSKNIYLTDQVSEGMVLIGGACNTYWLLIPQNHSTYLKIYKIDNLGVNFYSLFNLGYNVGLCSQIRYSKASNKIAIANIFDNGPTTVMNFDFQTGTISNVYAIPGINGSSSSYCGILDVEWSPSGKLLYLSRYRDCETGYGGQLLQFNTLTPSIPPVFIASTGYDDLNNLSKGLKCGPDGKIYHAYSTVNSYLGAILNPDILGLGCNYNPNYINFGVSIGNLNKLPEFLVYNSPITVTTTDTTICSGVSLTLTAIGAENYSWNNDSLIGSQITVSPTASSNFIVVGTSGTCTDSDTATITVTPSPNLNISNDTTITLGDTVFLNVSGANSYLWYPTTGLSCNNCTNPQAIISNSETYCVVGSNNIGCSDTACVNISIENECGNLFIPSAFSPNGDEVNDILYVYGGCISSFEFRIYNRWGNKVYESNDPNEGWNGLYQGKKLDTDVFVYYLKANRTDGSKVLLKGNVTLMQ